MATSTGEADTIDHLAEKTKDSVPSKCSTASDNHASTVAEHYNKLENAGLQARTQSRIFYLRNFNNWIKSMAIGSILEKIREERGKDAALSVLDLCGGKGGDLLKWRKGKISHLVLSDIAKTSVEQAEERYNESVERAKNERYPQKLFSAQFISADCSKERLKDLYKDPNVKFDLTSCQFSFHYSFESCAQADMMMRNAAECLRPGAYFILTTPNSYELMKRLRESDDMSFGNEVYNIKFLTDDKNNIPLFGAKYDFHLEGVVDCPEFLVYFPLLEKLAEKYGLKLVERKTFADYFSEMIQTSEGRALIGRMQSLEPYPNEDDVELMSKLPDAYSHAKIELEKIKDNKEKESSQPQSNAYQDYRRDKPIKVGTLSKAEWEATSIYLYCAFQKTSHVSENTTQRSAKETSTIAADTSRKCSLEATSHGPEEKVMKSS